MDLFRPTHPILSSLSPNPTFFGQSTHHRDKSNGIGSDETALFFKTSFALYSTVDDAVQAEARAPGKPEASPSLKGVEEAVID
jgi:hypothetical protein